MERENSVVKEEEIKHCELDLSNRFLQFLPDEEHLLNNFNPSKVTRLYLVGNLMSVVPDSIKLFQNLIELDLSSNGIAAISSHITELSKLKSFMAKNNNMDDLPKDFGQLVQLESLNFSGNRLTTFPPQIVELTNLKNLHLGGNSIRRIPPQIYNLRR